MANGMEDARNLEGYLMKEKSKLSLLHGLTGDVNKRYFRIRSIEGSEELALCYYKNMTDPEVRGWIYLKDVTEIAEHQDTIILISVARTLHLYAETRAQQNQWVTGLAKLCPDAFAMRGRNTSIGTTLGGTLPRGSARAPPTETRTVEASLTKGHHEPPMDAASADVSDTVTKSSRVDEEDSGPSTVEDHVQSEYFGTPREHENDSSASCRLSDGDRRQSGDCIGLAGNKGDKDWYHKHRSSDDGRRPQRSSTEFIKRKESSHTERVRCRKDMLGRRYHREQSANIVDEGDSPTNRCRDAVAADGEGDRCSPTKSEPPGPGTGLEASGTKNNANGKVEENGVTGRWSELRQTISARDDTDSDTTTEQEWGISTSERERVVVHEDAHGGECTKRSRIYSSDNENVETIELSEGTRSDAHDHAKHSEQQQAVDPVPAGVRKGSNQDEEKEFDEDAEIDCDVPQLEIANLGNLPPGQSATARLHRYISQSSTEAEDLNVSVPPPKEFLTQGSLKPAVSDQHEVRRANANAGQYRDNGETKSGDVPKSAPNGRRRTAADLEWGDGGETPDRPRCVEENMAQPVICGPVDLGDSDEEGKDDLDLEVEKQRRRAAAALVALEAAAKEADEGAQAESEALAKCKRKIKGGVRGVVTKAYPCPAAPPPPSLVRKARHVQDLPPPGVAPPKAVRPPRVKSANHRAVPDDNFVRDNWDDEIKTPCHGSPVPGGRDAGGLPAASVGDALNQASTWAQFDD